MARIITCKCCGEEGEHQAKGLIKRCYLRSWYRENKERHRESNRRWCKENPGALRAIKRRYRERNKDKARAYRQKNRDRISICWRRWAKEHREQLQEYCRNYYAKHKDKYLARARLYKAKKRALPDTLTQEQLEQLLVIGQAAYPNEKLHLDHFVSVNKGGGTTPANTHFIPAWMNLMKYDKLPGEAYKQLCLI